MRPPSADARGAAEERLAGLATPAGALGRLGDLAVWLAACQGAVPPRPVDNVRLAIFAGDHGVAAHGVSAYPPEITRAMVAGEDREPDVVDRAGRHGALARREPDREVAEPPEGAGRGREAGQPLLRGAPGLDVGGPHRLAASSRRRTSARLRSARLRTRPVTATPSTPHSVARVSSEARRKYHSVSAGKSPTSLTVGIR